MSVYGLPTWFQITNLLLHSNGVGKHHRLDISRIPHILMRSSIKFESIMYPCVFVSLLSHTLLYLIIPVNHLSVSTA
jgi:hypothetical protein